MGGAASYYLGKGGIHELLGGCDTVLLDGSHFAPLEQCHDVAKLIASSLFDSADADSGQGHPYYDGGTARL